MARVEPQRHRKENIVAFHNSNIIVFRLNTTLFLNVINSSIGYDIFFKKQQLSAKSIIDQTYVIRPNRSRKLCPFFVYAKRRKAPRFKINRSFNLPILYSNDVLHMAS